MLPARAATLKPGLSTFAITSDAAHQNLRTIANAAGYTGGACTITINGGVDVYSTSTGIPALVVGSWPASIVLTLINNGTVSGAGGAAGRGGGNNEAALYAGQPGAGGGPALDASMVSGFTFRVNNLGVLRGGGGGGGGGGNSSNPPVEAGGGGGGGGQGRNNAPGARGGIMVSGTNPGGTGGSGGAAGSGPGGPGGAGIGGNGGNGGAYGQPGGNGAVGVENNVTQPVYAGGAGGAVGRAVTGNGNIVWLATGTIQGGIV